MSKINRLPQGFQELLGNTSQGENPADLSQVVAPVIDMTPYYSVPQMQSAIVSGLVTTAGNGRFALVPPGEVWRPLNISAYMTGLAPGDTMSLEVALDAPGGQRHPLAYSPRYTQATATATTERYSLNHSFETPILIPSGWIFSAYVNSLAIAAPNKTLFLAVMYIKMTA